MQLIERFVTFHTKKRPFILLKWAESADGFIDYQRTEGKPVLLSSPLTSMLVHKLRAEYSAILVGRRTALLDNPSLTIRSWYGKNPTRIVIDKDLSLPANLHLFNGEAPTLVFTQATHTPDYPQTEFIQLNFAEDILPQIMEVLYQRKLQSLLVEGGSQTLQSFIEAELWDEVRIEVSPIHLNEGVKAPQFPQKYINLTKNIFDRNIKYAFKRGLSNEMKTNNA